MYIKKITLFVKTYLKLKHKWKLTVLNVIISVLKRIPNWYVKFSQNTYLPLIFYYLDRLSFFNESTCFLSLERNELFSTILCLEESSVDSFEFQLFFRVCEKMSMLIVCSKAMFIQRCLKEIHKCINTNCFLFKVMVDNMNSDKLGEAIYYYMNQYWNI